MMPARIIRISWFASCLFLSGLFVMAESSGEDFCKEKKDLSNNWLEQFSSIEHKEGTPSESDTHALLKPFNKNFNFDDNASCPKYQPKLKEAAAAVFRARASDFTPILTSMCSEPLPDTTDVSLLGFLKQRQRTSKQVLTDLKASTENCR